MGLENINWLGSIVGAVLAFILGALWYSPMLFAKRWMREFGFTEENLSRGNMAVIFSLAFVLLLLSALAFSKFLGPVSSLQAALCWGVVIGVFFAAVPLGVHYLFERRSLTLWLINGGYSALSFVLIGLVLGLWP